MMKAETEAIVDESTSADQLQEPLLIIEEQEEPPSEQDGCKRRGSSTIEVTEPLEVLVEPPDEDEWIGIVELRYLWILFQCVWPGLLLAFVWIDTYDEFVVLVVGPSALLLLLMAFWKGNKILEVRLSDVIPMAVWVAIPFLEFLPGVFLTTGVFLTMTTLLVAYTCFTGGFYCFYYNVFVRCWNRLNFYKHLEDDILEQQQEREVAEQEQLEAQYEKLSYPAFIA